MLPQPFDKLSIATEGDKTTFSKKREAASPPCYFLALAEQVTIREAVFFCSRFAVIERLNYSAVHHPQFALYFCPVSIGRSAMLDHSLKPPS
jgi:hypothetical protein